MSEANNWVEGLGGGLRVGDGTWERRKKNFLLKKCVVQTNFGSFVSCVS